jgi:uncharacterized membrane protein
MNVRRLALVGSVAIVAMLAVSAWAWFQIPEGQDVPVHWGPTGAVDGYGPKWLGLLGLPVIGAIVLAVLVVLPRIEPRRDHLARSTPAYVTTGGAVMLMLAGLHVAAVLAAVGVPVDVSRVAFAGAGLLFVVVGNMLGKTRSSWLFGIRTPWTLSSERSWSRTHRLGGRVFIVLGLAVLVVGIVGGPLPALVVLIGGLIPSVVGLAWYSYVVWRDDPDRESIARAA